MDYVYSEKEIVNWNVNKIFEEYVWDNMKE